MGLDIPYAWGIINPMKAQLLYRTKEDFKQGFIEVIIWKVPEPVPPSEHSFKYRMVYIVDGDRVVGYDNERGKGDHKHIDGVESPYTFSSVRQLVADFKADIEGLENG